MNISFDYDDSKAADSDDLNDALDYKAIVEKVISMVESSSFFLLEKFCTSILDIIMENQNISKTTVRIDKPNALNFADSVSVEKTRKK